MGSASGSGGAAQGTGEPHAGTGTGNGTEQMTSEEAESESLRGCGMPQMADGFDGPYYTKCMKEPVCTNHLCSLYRVSKFWDQKSWVGYPLIVAICLAALVSWAKCAPAATNGTGTNRWIREDTPERYHAPKVWLGAEGCQTGTRLGDRHVVVRDTDGKAIARPAKCPPCKHADDAGPRGRRQAVQ